MKRNHSGFIPAIILACGVAMAWLVAAIGGAPAGDTATLIVLALTGAGVAVLLVLAVTRTRRTSGMGTHAAAIALVCVAATMAGVVVGARAMFISSHDLTALGVIITTATAAGLAVAWRLGSRIDESVSELTELSEQLARGETPEPPESEVAELDRFGRDLVRMAGRLEEAHARELSLERSRRELVAWVSHDLRSPLAGIRAMAEAMEDGVVTDPEETRRYLRSIGEETERLARLVDDLFELSRVTSGAVGIDARPLQVTEVIRAGARGATPLAEAAQVDLRLPPAELTGALPVVHASEAETVRLLRNLLDNAIRHTPAGGAVSVEVEAHTQDGIVALYVIDECGGIPTEDLERVFDVAFRGDFARRRESGGGGLGLAIAKGLAEAQEGSIAVSNHDGGCCFTVELPVEAGGAVIARLVPRSPLGQDAAHVAHRPDGAPHGSGHLRSADSGVVVDLDLQDPPTLPSGAQHHLQRPTGSTVEQTQLQQRRDDAPPAWGRDRGSPDPASAPQLRSQHPVGHPGVPGPGPGRPSAARPERGPRIRCSTGSATTGSWAGSKLASASMKHTTSASAAHSPAQQAAPNPRNGSLTTVAPSSAATAAVRSVEPLSTTIGR